MFRVLVTDKIRKEGLTPLLDSPGIECVIQEVSDTTDLDTFDALLVRSATKVTDELMAKMPKLKIIARAGVGVDNIDVDAATRRGILVVNAPAGNTISTAEHTFAMMLALARKISPAANSLKSGQWNRSAFQGVELKGKTLGIIGFGRIGSEVAKRALAFDMTVLAYDPFLTKDRAEKRGVKPVSLNELLVKSDIITIHTPLTQETKGLLNMDTLKITKPGVLIVNCARGGIVDEEALKHYLRSGHIAGAALDVYESEPPQDYELIQMDNVLATPHIAASTKEAQLNVAIIVAEEVRNFAEGKAVLNGVNLPAVSNEVMERVSHYYQLTKYMGKVISKLAQGSVKALDVHYSGPITTLETSLITRGLLAGFLQPRVDFVVNDVNAPIIAKEYGIVYGEKYCDNGSIYTNLIKVVAATDNGQFTLEGTCIREYGPRIVNIDGFDIDMAPYGSVLVVEHVDKPGVIGKIGQVLGSSGINIGAMQVGRKQQGGAALMILNIDKPVTADVEAELAKVEDVTRITAIEF
ncbi:MAG: phosphoglycerate dehydrogenase [Limnochordia bacterium]|jgi:D-3-phosphoglycerate dehydrogenase|nr:phosphoglycerate dehydrogenase [Bacillota bacterium]HOB09106.1 phosphoglycerate dehydrogenase [Limnochordia bacterium]NLH31230.1 phosphoglycerate dehydrogenase [Bacillota bacterium]HPT93150.1 phosphoglycerate dehydrogenase [Limnochordia bacterium]HPZ30048.1 phosphoglycerate dehydrogenase [Limnochordia bacterium]